LTGVIAKAANWQQNSRPYRFPDNSLFGFFGFSFLHSLS